MKQYLLSTWHPLNYKVFLHELVGTRFLPCVSSRHFPLLHLGSSSLAWGSLLTRTCWPALSWRLDETLCRSPEFSLSAGLFSLVFYPVNSSLLHFSRLQIHLLNSWRPPGSTKVTPPCAAAWKFSPGSKLGLS